MHACFLPRVPYYSASTALTLLCLAQATTILIGTGEAFAQSVTAANGAQVTVPSAAFPATTYSTGAFAQNGYILFSTGVDPGTATPSLITGSGLTMSTSGDRAFVGRVEGNGEIVVSNSSLTTTGNLANALSADVGKITGTNLTIVTRGPTSSGAVGANGSTIGLTGGTIDTFNNNSFGLQSDGAGTTVTANGVAITTRGTTSHGAVATAGGAVTLSNLGINTLGSSAVGANVSGAGSSIVLNSVNITTAGGTSDGIRAGSGGTGGTATMTGGSIAVSGVSAYGVAAYGTGAVVTITGVSVSATGSASNGLYAPGSVSGGVINAFNSSIAISGSTGSGAFAEGTGSLININNTDIDTNKGSGFGARALGRAAVNVTNGSSIITRQANSSGIFADQNSTATFNDSTIETLADFSFGLYSQGGSVIDAKNASIVTRGASANGLYAVGPVAGTKITGNNVTVETFGADAYGARIIFGSEIALIGSSITTHGAGAHGVDMYAATGVANTFTATNTRINSGAASLNVRGGIGNITLTNVQTSSGTNQFLIVGTLPTTARFFAAADPEYTPPVVPASPANPVVANLTASGSTFVGNSFVALGDTANVTLKDATTLTGAFTTLGTSDVVLQGNSVWNVTGNSNVTTLLNDPSLINFTPPTGDPTLLSSYKTLTVVNYVGEGGAIALNTYLGADGAPSDRLVIDGGTATGSTTLVVRNTTGPGALTLSDGIKVVDAIDGATTADGSFVLRGNYITKDGQQAVVGGAYAYTLFHNGITDPTDSDWYLRSQIISTPVPPEPPAPRYQPGVPLYEVYPQHLLALNTVPTLQQRVGNRYWKEPAPETVFCKDASQNFQCPVSNEQAQYYAGSDGHRALIEDQRAIWGRIEGSHSRIEPAVTTSGTDYDTNVWKLQAGLDGLLHEAEDGSKLIGGITVHLGHASSDVTSFFGDGDIDTTGGGFGGTLTWYDQNGFYVDGQAQLSWFNSDLTSKARDLATPTLVDGNGGFGYALSVESGKKIDLNDSWTLTPQAQLVYANVDFSSFRDVFGANISLGSGDSLLGRLGISADHDQNWKDDEGKTRRRHLYGIANLYYQFLDATQVDVSGTSFESRPDRLWGGLGLGGSYNWDDDKYSVYGEVSVNSSLENFGDSYALAGTAGFRVRW